MSRYTNKSQRKLKNYIWYQTHGPMAMVPCFWCSIELSFDEATVDHEPSRELGGTDETAVLACRPCNMQRNRARQARGQANLLYQLRKYWDQHG